MDLESISAIAKLGMANERNRVELASTRLAMANTGYSSLAEAATAAQHLSAQRFETLIGAERAVTEPAKTQVKPVHDPGHPNADATGTVYYLDIDPIHEMATLVSALRSYEANVRAYNTNSEMTRSALSIGGN